MLETLGLRVNRLIRVSYGPFALGELVDGAVKEVETAALRSELGEKIVREAGCDFEAPLLDHDEHIAHRRHPEARARDTREPRRMTGPGRSSFEARQSRAPQDDGERPSRERGKWKQREGPKRRDRTGGPRPKYPRGK